MDRREFFGVGGMLGAAWASGATARGGEFALARRVRGLPRHLICLVADGMSMATLALADHYSWRVRGRGLMWVGLLGRPGVVNTFMNMRSLNSLVTDSSAASSSWGSGTRIMNSMVNVLPDGRVLQTLYDLLGAQGWTRGLVTTTEITHATPAGFGASGVNRDKAEIIATQYLDRRIEVLLGGGQKFFDKAKRKDKRDLYGDYRAAGYDVFVDRAGLAGAGSDRRWLGVFSESHVPFVIDRPGEAKYAGPGLVEMTRAALGRLERESRFVLQVEGGRVDHASHNDDAASAVREMIEFDETLEVCLEFQRHHPETLITVTSDHGTGNPGLNGMGGAYATSSTAFARLEGVRMSAETLIKKIEKIKDPLRVRAILEDAWGVEVSLRKTRALLPFLDKKGTAMFDVQNSNYVQLSLLLANHTGISYTSGNHTSDFVPLTVYGPGAERFAGFQQNVDFFAHVLGLARIDYRNPSVPLLEGLGLSAYESEFGTEVD